MEILPPFLPPLRLDELKNVYRLCPPTIRSVMSSEKLYRYRILLRKRSGKLIRENLRKPEANNPPGYIIIFCTTKFLNFACARNCYSTHDYECKVHLPSAEILSFLFLNLCVLSKAFFHFNSFFFCSKFELQRQAIKAMPRYL